MEAAVLAGIGLICLGAALWLVAEVRRQIREMTEILEEIQKGNGNRRLLASPGQLTAPLASISSAGTPSSRVLASFV